MTSNNIQANAYSFGIRDSISQLTDKGISHLTRLIEEDVCLSGYEEIDGISVWEKGKEEICVAEDMGLTYARGKFKGEYIPEGNDGTSFFHQIEGKTWHVRVHKC